MKKLRGVVAVVLALGLFAGLGGVVLADDPPGVDVDIGIISGGDVDVGLGIQAGGDVSIDVGTGNSGNVNIEGEPVSNLATKADLAVAAQGHCQYEEYVCGGSRMAIKEIHKILEVIYGRQMLIAAGLELEIKLTAEEAAELEAWLSRLTTYTYSQDRVMENQENAIVHVNEKMDDLIDVANHQVTALTEQTQRLEQAQLAMWENYNLKLMIASGLAIALCIALIVLLAKRRRA